MSSDLAVQCAKLPAWLATRRLIPEDYPKLLSAAEVRIIEARKEEITDKAANELISEHGENVHYLAAKKIYEAAAKSPEGQAKSMLGGHSHPGVAKWKAVLDMYKRRHLGWASAARLLIQNASYEIPALKKQAAACERQVADCTARQADLDRQEANARTRYRELLAEMGIEGIDIRNELTAHSAQELPKLALEMFEILREVGEDLHSYYRAFGGHVAGRPAADVQVLPFLLAVATSSEVNVEDLEEKVPEFRTARVDAESRRARRPQPVAAEQVAAGASATIDWGITMESDGAADAGSGGINWEVDDAKEAPAISSTETGAQGGIDWSAISFDGLEVSAEKDPEDLAASQGPGLLLADHAARELLMREVAEAAAFLVERCADLAAGGAGSEEYGPREEQRSLAEVEGFRDKINKVEGILTSRRTQRLVLLHSSKSYLERAARRIEVAKQQCGKPGQRKAELEKVKAEQLAEAKRARAEIDKLKSVTLAAKEDLEGELSAHFKSTVRIVGEILQI